MGNTINAGGGATSIVSAYYEKRFLLESRKNLVLEPLAMNGTVPKGQGKLYCSAN